MTHTRCGLAGILFLALTLGLLAGEVAQDPQASGVATRDAFGTSGKLPRLSPAEFANATASDVEPDIGTKANKQKDKKPAQPPIELHRLSRDVLAKGALTNKKSNEHQITLKNWFIEKYKNRATITSPFLVVHAGKVHAASDDGDQHISGLAEEVMLPMVAEIMNAKHEPKAVALVHSLEASGDHATITGAWRLWCEHPGKEPHIQDDVIAPYPHSNPDHVFEIHPVSRLNNIAVLNSFKPIPGYEPKEAKRAFQYYESVPCRIVPDPDTQTTTLFTPQAKFNYVEFKLRLEEDEQFLTFDGRIVRCSALALDGEEVAHNRRMIFIKDTPPEKAVRGLSKGDTLHVLGIPRVDLALVSWRARNAQAHPEALEWHLPYEILVVGVYHSQHPAQNGRVPSPRVAVRFDHMLAPFLAH